MYLFFWKKHRNRSPVYGRSSTTTCLLGTQKAIPHFKLVSSFKRSNSLSCKLTIPLLGAKPINELSLSVCNVSKVLKVLGVSRDAFYWIQEFALEGGGDTLISKFKRAPTLKTESI
jgi:hypothetical protein